jgi:hypothetical protein
MLSFLFKFTQFQNSLRPFWKLLASESLFGILGTWQCSMFVRDVKIVPLLDVHQLLILLAGTLTYMRSGAFASIVFFNIY